MPITAEPQARQVSTPARASVDFQTEPTVAIDLFFGVYNFVRRHETLGTTPAVAAGVELKRWNLEDVVEMTAAYIRRKEDAKFEAAFGSVLI
jgi:hypothetical protein